MGKTYVLYNPKAGNGVCAKKVHELDDILKDNELIYVDYISMTESLADFLAGLINDDEVILCGGDGTINVFINEVDPDNIKNKIYYYPLGSGNDFYNDVKHQEKGKLIELNKYIKNLPFVSVNGMERRFINAIGYGIDGYCCEEGDRVRKLKQGKPVNYTVIALKGLLYDYAKASATVTIDGTTTKFQNVWMVPTLNGRYYGGGMKCAPNQDRLFNDDKVTVIAACTASRLKALLALVAIFYGGHIKHKSVVTELKGKNVTVTFDRPTPLQIDGETVVGVTKYSVYRR